MTAETPALGTEMRRMAADGDARREAGRAAFQRNNMADFVAHDAADGTGQVGDARAHLAAVDRQLAQHLLPERIRQTLLAQKEKLLRTIHGEPVSKAAAPAAKRPKLPMSVVLPMAALRRRYGR